MPRDLIFVDTETTGLVAGEDSLVELTWAPKEGDPHTLYFGIVSVPPFIDNLIKFTERGIAGRRSTHFEIEDFLKASDGQTMVAANPAFDKGFVEANGLWRFGHRMLDIETYAMAKLNLDYAPSMAELHKTLTDLGYEITQPDHTSRADVLAMRDAFLILEGM